MTSSRMKLPIDMPPQLMPLTALPDIACALLSRRFGSRPGMERAPCGTASSMPTDACRGFCCSASSSARLGVMASCTSILGWRSCEVRFDCWLRGEVEVCRRVAMSIGEAASAILNPASCGEADGKSGSVVSSSSGGKSRSSLLK